MKILNKELLDQFSRKHTQSIKPLQRWCDTVVDAQWKTHNDLKADFPSADFVGLSRYVFNIKGNSYRVITVVTFITGFVIIRFVGTHSEYDQIDAKKI
jgi:mRNA interferase HigB